MENNNKHMVRSRLDKIDEKLKDVDFKLGSISDKLELLIKYNNNSKIETDKKIKAIQDKQNEGWFWLGY